MKQLARRRGILLPPRLAAGLGPLAFVLAVGVTSVVFTNTYVAGVQSRSVELFTDLFIPALTVMLHLTAARLLPAAAFAAVVVLDGLLTLVLATYHGYFGENLDIHVVIGTASEAVQVVGYALQLIPPGFALLVATTVALELLLRRCVRAWVRPKLLVAAWAPVCAAAALGLWKVPPERAPLITDYALSIKLHGYYSALAFDLLYAGPTPSDEALRGTLEALQRERPTPIPAFDVELPPGIRHIVVIQVESLDWNVLGAQRLGRPITPFLSALADSTLTLKLDSNHSGGSGTAGADYQFLTRRMPLANYPTFKVRGLDYGASLPALLDSLGVASYAFHGNDASMWSRGAAFAGMGFDRFFSAPDFPKADSRWGISDSTFFAESLRHIDAAAAEPGLFYLITLTSHGPFDYVENPVFPGDDMVGRYFNSINYVDRHLERFVRALRAPTLLVVFGDHTAAVGDDDYRSHDGTAELVPGIVAWAGGGAVGFVAGRGELGSATSGELDLRSLGWLVERWARALWSPPSSAGAP